MKTVFLLCAVSATLLAGCAIHSQSGSFLGSEADGWIRSFPAGSGGLTAYEPPHRELRRLEVTFSTSEKGHVYAHISYLEEKLRLDEQVIVSFPSSSSSLKFPAKSLLDGLDIPVGDAHFFKVEIPEFTAKGRKLPALVADFSWSAKTYYYTRGLQ